jgi:hypothetical protein
MSTKGTLCPYMSRAVTFLGIDPSNASLCIQTLPYICTAKMKYLYLLMEMQSLLRILVHHICDTNCGNDLQ